MYGIIRFEGEKSPSRFVLIMIIRGKKNLWNSEFSQFRLFAKIEWVPPFKTEKLLRVMRITGKTDLRHILLFFLIALAKNMPG